MVIEETQTESRLEKPNFKRARFFSFWRRSEKKKLLYLKKFVSAECWNEKREADQPVSSKVKTLKVKQDGTS